MSLVWVAYQQLMSWCSGRVPGQMGGRRRLKSQCDRLQRLRRWAVRHPSWHIRQHKLSALSLWQVGVVQCGRCVGWWAVWLVEAGVQVPCVQQRLGSLGLPMAWRMADDVICTFMGAPAVATASPCGYPRGRRYNDALGQTSCKYCPAGTFSAYSGAGPGAPTQAACQPCAIGKYRRPQVDAAPVTVDFSTYPKPPGAGCAFVIPDYTAFAGFRWRGFALNTCEGTPFAHAAGYAAGVPAYFWAEGFARFALHGVNFSYTALLSSYNNSGGTLIGSREASDGPAVQFGYESGWSDVEVVRAGRRHLGPWVPDFEYIFEGWRLNIVLSIALLDCA